MQENNNLETNQNSSLYGETPSQTGSDAGENGYSIVYGEQFQPDTEKQEHVSETTGPVQLSKEDLLKKESSQRNTNQPNSFQKSGNIPPMYGNNQQNSSIPPMYGNTNQRNNFQQNGNTSQPNNFQQGSNILPMYGNNQPNNFQQNGNIPPMYGMNQPSNNPQWGYNNQPNPNQPPRNQKPKKSGTAIFFGILAAAAAVLIVVLLVMFSKSLFRGRNPQEQVKKGLENMAQEMEAYTSSISEDIGSEALEKLGKTTPMHTDINLSFTLPYAGLSDFDNVSIGLDAISDIKERKASCDLSVGMYGFQMSVGDIVVADNTLYFEIPLLYDDVYSVDVTNFGRDFNSSAWSDFLEMEVPEDQVYSLFDTAGTVAEKSKYDEELEEILKKYSKMLTDATQYKMISQQKEFEVGENTVICKGISQIVDKDVFNEMISGINRDIQDSDFYTDLLTNVIEQSADYDVTLEELREEADEILDDIMSMQIDQDFVINYYLDNKGRIVNISTPEDISVSGSSIDAISIDLNFTGEKRTLDEVKGGIYLQTDDTVLYFGIEREASITNEMYSEDFSILLQDDRHVSDITFKYWNDWNYEDKSYDMWMSLDTTDSSLTFSADGRFSDIVKGESYTFRVNNATLNIDGTDLIIISGTVKVEPTDKEIEIPEEAIDLLDMDESEIEQFLYDSDMLIG